MGVLYHLLIVAIAVAGIVRGFRYGALSQTGSVLAIAFGCVADRMFHEASESVVTDLIPATGNDVGTPFLVSLLTSALIFLVFYLMILAVMGVVDRLLRLAGGGMLDAIMGAILGLFRWLFMLSLCLNFVIGFQPDSVLVKYGMDSDGNLAEGVLYLAPSLLDCENFRDLARRKQLREAKKISSADNKGEPAGVYHQEGHCRSEICICNA